MVGKEGARAWRGEGVRTWWGRRVWWKDMVAGKEGVTGWRGRRV